MSSLPSLQTLLVFEHRESKRDKIQRFFTENLGKKFSSQWLHGQWGSSFRTRVSDINQDKGCNIVIRNQSVYDDLAKAEISVYWAEVKP